METVVVIGVVGLALCGLARLFVKRMRNGSTGPCGGACSDCPSCKFTCESADIKETASAKRAGDVM